MDLGTVFYLSMVLFFISVLGILITSDLISFFISRQVMVAAAVINFLNFSLCIIPGDNGLRILMILGLLTMYLIEFTVLFYIYSNTDSIQKMAASAGYGIFSLKKSDWWGEDRV